MKHPIQKPYVDHQQIIRFTANNIVTHALRVLEEKGYNLNHLHMECCDLDKEDWDQFYQLIGYSLSGAPVSELVREAATLMHNNGVSQEEARATNAEERLNEVKNLMREGISVLYETCMEEG